VVQWLRICQRRRVDGPSAKCAGVRPPAHA
jgi:hypothetical protein